MPENSNQVTDTSGITEGDGHWMHDHQDVIADPAMKNAYSKYKTVDEALKGGHNAITAVGRPHINIPADDADTEKKLDFRKAIAQHMGKPDSIEGYKVQRPEGSDETNYNFEAEKVYLETAFKLDANQSQVEAFYELHNTLMDAAFTKEDTDLKKTQDETQTKMTGKLGGEANYKVYMEQNTKLLETFFGEQTAKDIDACGLGDREDFMKGIHELYEMAVAEGRTLKASHSAGEKKEGALTYKKMRARKEAEKK